MKKSKLNKTTLIILIILSVIFAIAGVCYIPILTAFGVDVFALRGVLLFSFIPIVSVCCIPLGLCINYWSKNKEALKKKNHD